MTGKLVRGAFIVLASVIAIVFVCTAFSVSYALWNGPNGQQLECTAATGEWEKISYTLQFDDGTTKSLTTDNTNETSSATFDVSAGISFELLGNGTPLRYQISAGKDIVQFAPDGSYEVIETEALQKLGTIEYKIKVTNHASAFTMELTNSQIRTLLGGGNNVTGVVTSNGKVINFDKENHCEIKLEPNESFNICIDGEIMNTLTLEAIFGKIHIKTDKLEFNGSDFVSETGGTFKIAYTEEEGIFGIHYDDIIIT